MNIINLTGKEFPMNKKRLDIYDNLPLEWGMNFFKRVYQMGAVDIYEQQMQYTRLMTIWKTIPVYLVSDSQGDTIVKHKNKEIRIPDFSFFDRLYEDKTYSSNNGCYISSEIIGLHVNEYVDSIIDGEKKATPMILIRADKILQKSNGNSEEAEALLTLEILRCKAKLLSDFDLNLFSILTGIETPKSDFLLTD